MKNLQLVKSESFGEIQADIYSNENEMFMTINQLAECLEYSNGRKGIENILSRNEYLKNPEFSVTLKLRGTDGKQYNNRVFTEDGIYEITMLSNQPKAKEFRAWVRKVLKDLRTGKSKLISMTEYQRLMVETRQKNAQTRTARELLKLAEKHKNKPYAQVLESYATKELTGEHLIPLPEITERTYSATEIGKRLGITPNKVGKLANKHNLKTDKYGKFSLDKAKYCDKEVESFRYYESVIDVLKSLLTIDKAG